MALTSGTKLGPYEIVSPLGAGGMGEVYRARDIRLDRIVAIKMISERREPDGKTRKQLLQEARIASGLNHPNICTIHEVGEAEDISYIVMEYVAGRTLTELRGPHGLPAQDVTRYGIQIADALTHAHEHGVVHRDLKSDNIIVTEDDRTKILDFGLAECLSAGDLEQATLSHSAMSDQKLAGTLPYMAPEILQGQTADMRADIWALGVVLYEIASGTRPFQGKTAFELTSAILKGLPPALSSDIPPGLRNVIQRCLQKAPAQRYLRSSEVRAALEAIQSGPTCRLPAKRPAKAIESLAVLPFSNIGGDANTEYLCDGITEAIINSLSQMPKLRVISRSTAFRYKKRDLDLQTIGDELNVRAVLGGRVLQRGENLIISTELVDVANQSQLWGQQYNRKMADILAIQEDIASEISEKLRLQLSREDRRKLIKRQTDNTQAYQLYLKGRYFLNRRTADAFQRGIQALQQAIACDSRYALAYAGLADAHLLTAWWESVPTEIAIQQAEGAAKKALDIDDTFADPHTTLGLTKLAHHWDWEGGVREMRRATELNPRYTQGYYWCGFALCALGRSAEGGQCTRRAHELEPLNLVAGTFHAVIPNYFERRFEVVVDALSLLVEMDPDLGVALFFRALALLSANRMKEAVAQAEHGAEISGRLPLTLGVLGLAYGSAGYHDRARQVLMEIQARARYVPPLPLALTYAGLGEMNDAFHWLENAVQERSLWTAWLKVDPRFDLFRDDPRYYSILERMRLPPR
jgi:eukaryotic-like serine/threonine-protein kinase